MNQIQVPLGMKDILIEDSYKKSRLQAAIEQVFSSYGYQKISTPTIEFSQTYENAFGSKPNEMYKFFDQDGQILGLRMDETVPIARVTASKFNNSNPPYRFQYCSNVFKLREIFAGKLGEVTDLGVELIGLDSSSDIEVLACALDTLEAIGLDDYTLEIGNSDFFKKACHLLQLNDEITNNLADLIDRKSLVELNQYLQSLNLNNQQTAFFKALPLLGGSKKVLEEALQYCFDEQLQQCVLSLKQLSQQLEQLGYSDHVTFDLGKVPHLDYYTGIIFEGFTSNVGQNILSGGRYDSLLAKFGRDLPAIGFSVKLDYLLDVYRCDKPKRIQLYYPKEKQMEALLKAKELRKENIVELIPWDKPQLEVVS